jgi:uncharacterized protein YfaP (DUF2135 family)
MSRRIHAIAAFLVMLFVVAACGASLAHAAEAATDVCGPAKGWAATKGDSSTSAKPDVAVSATPVASLDVSEPAPRWAGVEDAAPASARVVLVQPRASRAPPLA